MTAPQIVVERVSKAFQSSQGPFVALADVDLTIDEGEFVSVVGPSGCGKSTLLEIVAGLQRPTRGRVIVDGQEVVKPGPDRAVVFQDYALFPWRTVLKNVTFPMELAGVDRAERRQRALSHLRMVGLEAFAGSYVWQLSGGMQQRVALARAMACTPKVMLMDEPFSGADAITRELLQDQLLELHRQTRKSVLFVTHSVDEAIHLSNRVVVMGTRPGRIVAQFSIDGETKEHPERTVELRGTIWSLLRKEIQPTLAR